MRHLDLFSGIGGFALAAKWANIETVGFCEIDSYCQKVLNKHWPEVPIIKDIRELKNDGQFGTIDIITGGFPCQPFSIAGKKRGTNDNRDLWPEVFRVIKEFKPTWVIGENVANFINMGFERTKTDLESEKYEVQCLNIPACALNAPHQRKRIWILAYSESSRYNGGGQNKMGSSGKMANGFTRSSEALANTKTIYAQGQSKRQGEGEFRGSSWWKTEPELGRVANGIPNRVDRLKCLGNAIVPQIAYEIMEKIKILETNTN